MASRKKGSASAKPKKVYESVKLANCTRCGRGNLAHAVRLR